ncbi:hypothetical protein BVER_06112 [Candidatus Burkholderia verschuerenii]|uniref:Uncharacterized protein n=1 Tax=Candidatus Burkholderia verschuerenii TaxID=242163 RepID=A0A0L0MG22_9BURK|nr:hypothetical protein [Candidatus Burkholderia verschuerenii]KND61622.1 hypothetical protein BVER_06112 [Candidatus Burkholderia verschuerenii]
MNATSQVVRTHEVDEARPTPDASLGREWRDIEQNIARLFDGDARDNWIAAGSWRPVSNAVEPADVYRSAPSDRGLFSSAHAWFAEAAAPRADNFAAMVSCGFLIGAIERTGALIELGQAHRFECDEAIAQQVMEARSILREAEFTDERIARQLDAAAKVLRRHGLRPTIVPRIILVEGVCKDVTYLLNVPIQPERADDLNFELVLEEIEADIVLENAFDARFNGIGK